MKSDNKKIIEELEKKCVCCGKNFEVEVFEDQSYRGGSYFGKIGKVEDWECDGCWKDRAD